ncbi:GntR family transcriptional regulator [Aliiruegeria lutimaris]|uniref:Transcriptional regulator, GntR family n=1 Tax=Aliiruegeria lutimaris TaxID=571298 RepID=A0A1G9HLE8_9RHOB|nr:FCD domain-containing protein [Aliiruegeria lutimaris]SDL13574.1 transcriptional regulator, GntR family [Aliiruegeria lutimaris]
MTQTKTLAANTEAQTLSETAYRSLKSDIIRGERIPGERLRIERLKGIYGIGPTPLREALQKLSQDGLVTSEGNRGFTVAPLDPGEFADLNLARTAIEKEALRLSIEKGDDDWEARVVAASYIMRKEDKALPSSQSGVPDSWERANAEFHTALVSACGSAWLLKIRAGLHELCERYRRASVYQKMGSRNLETEHAEIAEAVLARDTARAVELVERHFALTASSLIKETGTPAPAR